MLIDVDYHLLKTETSLVRVVLVNGYNGKLPGVSLILCLFSKTMVVHFLLGSLTNLFICAWPYNSAKYRFHLVEQALNLVRKWLVTPLTFLLLLHHEYVLPPVIAVALRTHSWAKLVIAFFFSRIMPIISKTVKARNYG